MATENTSYSSKVFSVFAILGFTALLIIGAWSAYQVVKFAPRLWGGEALTLPSLSGAPEVTITLENTELVSDEPVDITWDASGTLENGVFSFAYACREGLRIDVLHMAEDGTEDFRVLPCNAPYSIPADDRVLTIRPAATAERFVDGAFAVTFTDEDGESVRDTKSITVVNDTLAEGGTTTNTENTVDTTDTTKNTTDTTTKEGTQTTTTRAPIKEGTVTYGNTKTPTTKTVTRTTTRTIQVPVYPTNDPYGTPDLSVEIIRVDGGLVGGYNPYNQYGASQASGTATFRVHNYGTKETGAWTFIAQLPTASGYTFTSQPQTSILPNGYSDITLTFTQVQSGAVFAVQVDPNGVVYETNEYNNYASQPVYGYAY